MKRRVRKIANFFAFNLLFFALYLNFIHRDNVSVTSTQQTAAFSGTALVDNPEQATENKTEAAVANQQTGSQKIISDNSTALKLSIN